MMLLLMLRLSNGSLFCNGVIDFIPFQSTVEIQELGGAAEGHFH